jgi:hypothetical protein
MLLIVLASMGTVAYVVDHVETDTDAELLRIEEANEVSNRATAYRLCSRNRVDRAFAHDRVGPADARELMRNDGIPILNCRPNLDGRGAQPWSFAEQRAFVRRWRQGRLSNEELGICPESVIGEKGSARDC